MVKRSMWPKEHGAYAQLGFPLVTALVAGRSTLASLALVVAACATFVAHEPFAVLLGVRGTRARRESGRRAKAWLFVSAAIALICGLTGLIASSSARPFAAAACGAAGLAALFLYERKERTVAGEVIAGAALAAAAAPAGAASGLPAWLVITCWAVWSAQFLVTTIAVHAFIRRRPPAKSIRAVGVLLAVMLALSGATLAIGAHS